MAHKYLKTIYMFFAAMLAPFAANAQHAFTMTLNIDNAAAVSIAVDGEEYVEVHDGDNVYSFDQGIVVAPNAGYAVTKAQCVEDGSDYLQYAVQRTPFTIRGAYSDGMGGVISHDGHTVNIRTISDGEGYALTINVDHAADVVVKIGASNSIYTTQNRRLELVDGTNQVTFSDADRWIVAQRTAFDDIYSITINGKAFYGDGADFGQVYCYPLTPSLAGAVVEIVAKEPVEGSETFTFTTDNADNILYFTREAGNGKEEKELFDLLGISSGSNTVPFDPGDVFTVTTVGYIPQTATIDGTPIAGSGREYTFTPSAGSVVEMNFGQQGTTPDCSFTLAIDDVGSLSFFTLEPATELLSTLHDGVNTVYFSAGDRFSIWPKQGKTPTLVTIDDEPISKTNNAYYFTPENHSIVKVVFSDDPDIPIEGPAFDLLVDDISKMAFFTLETGNGKAETELLDYLANGVNTIHFDVGDRFSIWPVFSVTPLVITIDGVDIPKADGYNAYYFTPEEGSVVKVQFNADDTPVVDSQFTVDIDDVGQLQCFKNYTTAQEIELHNGENTIPFVGGHQFFFTAVDWHRASLFTLDGADVEFNGFSYLFYPENGSHVVIRVEDHSGLDSLVGDGATVDVFTTGGVLVKPSATAADLRALPAGIYVVRGRKIAVVAPGRR